jgi:hypothetical protein
LVFVVINSNILPFFYSFAHFSTAKTKWEQLHAISNWCGGKADLMTISLFLFSRRFSVFFLYELYLLPHSFRFKHASNLKSLQTFFPLLPFREYLKAL